MKLHSFVVRAISASVLATVCAGTCLAADMAGDKTRKGQILDRGRYLVRLGGCNDCHTPGYSESNGKLPEAQWLTGVPLGWKGPWGTTYAPNLRLYFAKMNADEWVKTAHSFKTRPPMPWYDVDAMTNSDLRAMHAYISSLGPAGGPAPAFVPPGVEPTGPVVVFPAPPPRP